MSHYRLLIPTTSASRVERLFRVAAAFVTAADSSGTLLGVIEVPPDPRASTTRDLAHGYRTLVAQITRLARSGPRELHPLVRIAHVAAQGIREAALETGSNLLMLDSGTGAGRGSADGQWTNAVEDLLYDPPCQVVLVRPEETEKRITSVLVPVRGGPNAELAVQLASTIARSTGAALCLLHVFNPRGGAEAVAEEEATFERLAGLTDVPLRRLTVTSAGVREAIMAEAARHELTILGATLSLMHRPMVLGLPLPQLLRRLPGTVLVAKTPGAAKAAANQQEQPRIESRAAVAQSVDRWFTENTFHHREFAPLRRLVDLKQRQGHTISLALPTHNDEVSVGPAVETFRHALVRRLPLLDEIVVVDSASTDRTVRAAQSAGAVVVQHADILPRYGSFAGKGEALWKSLHVLTGDLICWVDPSVGTMHPGLVTGLLGPLLTDPDIHYVKGFSPEPLRAANGHVQGGDRVTELAARPLLNLLFPELSGLIQPLSGQYAGRRHVLERIPFFTGYGVAIGLLLAIAEAYGIRAIAQVNVGGRQRASSSPFELSQMAFAITQVALKRLGDRHRIHLVDEINRTMKVIHYEDERFWIEQQAIEDVERPPMDTVPEALRTRQVSRKEN